MGQLFDEFVRGKDEWKSIAKKAHFRQLLTKAITTEKDVPAEKVLDVLVAAVEGFLVAPPAVYEGLATRGKPGWLAAAGRKSVADPKKSRRIEAARWLQYGRAGNRVSKEDLDALKILLLDKDEDVRSVATYPLNSMAAEDPDQVVAHLKSWIESISLDQRLGILASLAPAWACNRKEEVFAMQEPALASPKHRFQFLAFVDQSLNRQPISLKAAEAGWDHLLAPAVNRLLSGEWKPASAPNQDVALVRLMGKLLALRPAPSMIRRAEEEIERLLQAANKAVPPAEIMFGPQRELGDLASTVWPGYQQWWQKMIKLMSRPESKKTWRDDLKESEAGLRELASAKGSSDISVENLNCFQRSALESSRNQKSR